MCFCATLLHCAIRVLDKLTLYWVRIGIVMWCFWLAEKFTVYTILMRMMISRDACDLHGDIKILGRRNPSPNSLVQIGA